MTASSWSHSRCIRGRLSALGCSLTCCGENGRRPQRARWSKAASSGCGSCHSLSELGSDATGTIGPNLDTALVNRDAKFIEESIVDPSAYVAKGYPDGTMPSNFSDQLSQEQINAIVDFLVQSTSGGGSGSSGG